MLPRRIVMAALLALFAASTTVWAGAVKSWSASSTEQFSDGALDGTAIDEEGRLRIAQELETLWGPEEGIVWDVTAAGEGGAFVALSSPGRLIRAAEGQAEVWHTAPDESVMAAVAADGAGGVWVGLSPEGQVLHVSGAGEAEVAVETGALFVWALARDTGGALWIGTGMPGLVLRVAPGGEPETLFDAGDDPIRCLVALPDGGMAVGTGGRGLVIRVDASGRPFVVYDAEEREIVALDVDPEGTLFALAAMGPKEVRRSGAPPMPQVPGDSVRVTATPPSGSSSDEGPTRPTTPDQAQQPGRRLSTPPGAVVYRIGLDGGAQRIWESKRDIPFALTRGADGKLLVATGDKGRVFRIDEEGRSTRLFEISSDQASALATLPDGGILVGGTTDARVERLGAGPTDTGRYVSPAIDATTTADWGRIAFDADVPRGARLRLAVRAGNTSEPDETWSDWVELDSGEAGDAATDLPATRWLQARFDLESSKTGGSPVVRRLEVFYLPHNRPPVIEELNPQPAGIVWSRVATQSARPQGPIVTQDPVSRRAVERLSKNVNKPVRKSYELGARTITWKAIDPDGDTLVYTLEVQRDDRASWLPLAVEISAGYYGWDARGMPDGLYRVRLTASDSKDNADGKEFRVQRVSPVFEIDNTRPFVASSEIRLGGAGYEVEFVATDPGGNVAAVEVAVDGGAWQPIDPLDGVADSSEERYQMKIDSGAAAETPRSLRVRVTDAAGNLGGDGWSLDE